MNSLNQTINTLASEFAEGVVKAIRAGSIDELLNGQGTRSGARAAHSSNGPRAAKSVAGGRRSVGAQPAGGRLQRRSIEDIDAMAESIVQLVRSAGKDGMRAEVIREKLGIERKELPRPLAQALNAGWLKTSGQKRATTYFAGGKKVKASSKKTAKKTSKKASKRTAKKGKR